jgi:hypothetical protein
LPNPCLDSGFRDTGSGKSANSVLDSLANAFLEIVTKAVSTLTPSFADVSKYYLINIITLTGIFPFAAHQAVALLVETLNLQ